MARAANMTSRKDKPVVQMAAEPTPKKKPGRPPGSKNRVLAPGIARSASAAAAKPVAGRKIAAAAAASKLSKAELEHQLIKLERTIVRLRKHNAELKAAVPKAGAGADEAERPKAGRTPTTAAVRGRKPAPASRTTKAKKSKPLDQETVDLDDENGLSAEAKAAPG